MPSATGESGFAESNRFLRQGAVCFSDLPITDIKGRMAKN